MQIDTVLHRALAYRIRISVNVSFFFLPTIFSKMVPSFPDLIKIAVCDLVDVKNLIDAPLHAEWIGIKAFRAIMQP